MYLSQAAYYVDLSHLKEKEEEFGTDTEKW
jgi:hypothetical protein